MQPKSTAEIRTAYLEFFKSKGHAIIPSGSLVPENDPTTLFTGSGMQPMLPYLLGETHSLGNRISDSQKCFRSVDIEEVGDNRHTTFFEMLGNWSFGDYFKKEQIEWMFEFLTKVIKIDPTRLFVTVFRGNGEIPRDEESVETWKKQFATVGINATAIDNSETLGMQDGRIFYYNEKKNWWSRAGEPAKMPVGEPGGPDSEMFWDFGSSWQLHEQSQWKDTACHVNCDCGRFLEIGNNVFMEYMKKSNGFEKLVQQNVDFGGGLERIAAAVNDDPDVFKIDVFTEMRSQLEKMSGKKYEETPEIKRSFRIILDHLRVATFLTADGAAPSNKDQGYFTRRMLRRAIRFANAIGIPDNFCPVMVQSVITTYSDAYPYLLQKKAEILSAIEIEEQQFRRTLTKGEKELMDYLSTHDTIDGAMAFYFFETYGFPLELTEELLKEKGKILKDPAAFEVAKEKHQKESRAGAEKKFSGGLADHSDETTKLHTATHLLNSALRQVLGQHVWQKGSNITAERLRFDFTHGEKMTPEQIKKVEDLVNDAIKADAPISYSVMTVDEAKVEGAIGVFGDKYGEKVKVYTMGAFSKEICGGPHVARTGMLGSFKIQKEESSSSGVRRIKAVVSGGPATVEVAGEAL